MRADYEPRYPRRLSPEEVRLLLRPGLLERFGQSTMLAGAVLVGSLLVVGGGGGCDQAGAEPRGPANAANPDPAAPGGATATRPALKSTRVDADLKARVDAIVTEVLGDAGEGRWNERAALRPESKIAANPPVKTPAIGISFGNSYVGVFDVEAAREVTRRLFTEYGIDLQPRVRVEGDGYEFVADGYDAGQKVGFEIVDEEAPQRLRFGDGAVVPAASRKVLEEKELPKVAAAIEAGDVKMFVAHAEDFPNMDGDLYTPMEYYLASVVDYLNWIHGDRQIDRDRVLGKPPGAERRKAEQAAEARRKRQKDEAAAGEPAGDDVE